MEEAIKHIPGECLFIIMGMGSIITALSTAVVYLFFENKRLSKELVKFATKGTEAIELISKISKNEKGN